MKRASLSAWADLASSRDADQRLPRTPRSSTCPRAGGPKTSRTPRPGRGSSPGAATSRSASPRAGSTPRVPSSGPTRCSTGSKATSWRAATTWRRPSAPTTADSTAAPSTRRRSRSTWARTARKQRADMPSSAARSPSTASIRSATKKELTTHLEIFRWYCPDAKRTAVLILRSPHPFQDDDPVWKAPAAVPGVVRLPRDPRATASRGFRGGLQRPRPHRLGGKPELLVGRGRLPHRHGRRHPQIQPLHRLARRHSEELRAAGAGQGHPRRQQRAAIPGDRAPRPGRIGRHRLPVRRRGESPRLQRHALRRARPAHPGAHRRARRHRPRGPALGRGRVPRQGAAGRRVARVPGAGRGEPLPPLDRRPAHGRRHRPRRRRAASSKACSPCRSMSARR